MKTVTEPSPRERPSARVVKFWSDFFRGQHEDPVEFLETITLLRRSGRMGDVEAALRGYLQHNPKLSQPWMYEMLAVAMEYNAAEPKAVQQALAYAASVARKEGADAAGLVTVADLMASRGTFEVAVPDGRGGTIEVKVGELLDLAIEKLPHRPEPIWKSIDLADRTKDGDRMGRTVERLLSLGWPGSDKEFRSEGIRRANALADALRDSGKTSEAEALRSRVAAAKTRDLVIRLKWEGLADLDLEVAEPLGAVASFRAPRTVFGGAIVENGRGKDAEETYTCPLAFDGSYEARVDVVVNDDKAPVTKATIEVVEHEGTPEEKLTTHEIDLDRPEPVVIDLNGGRRTEVLPYIAPKVIGVVVKPPAETKSDGRAQPAPATGSKPTGTRPR